MGEVEEGGSLLRYPKGSFALRLYTCQFQSLYVDYGTWTRGKKRGKPARDGQPISNVLELWITSYVLALGYP